MNRTTTSTAVFRRPFRLGSDEGTFPAGTYVIETEEEEIAGLSFQAFRRVSTTIRVPSDHGGILNQFQALRIDPEQLRKALELDAASTRE